MEIQRSEKDVAGEVFRRALKLMAKKHSKGWLPVVERVELGNLLEQLMRYFGSGEGSRPAA